MVNINGNDYGLCLVDTNIVSEMVKNPSREFNKFLEMTLLKNEIFPCFSLFTILELRKRKDVYGLFLEFFSFLPCVIAKAPEQLLSDEIESYPDYSNINPVLIVSSGIADNEYNRLDYILDRAFEIQENIKNESYLNDSRNDILAATLSLRDNFPSENGKYSPKQIRKFIELAGSEKLFKKSPVFVKNLRDKKEIESIDAFPSLKMRLLTVFYKFYNDNNRKTSASDVFDVNISSLTPYVDAVFTENHQAKVINKIKNFDSFLNHIRVFRLKDLQ